ncbi:hypothetical protein ACW5BZ_08365 [Pediococcus pentosaceus]
MVRDEQQKVFFFAKQGENYIPLRFKRSEQQRASKQSSSATKSDQDISNIGMQKGTTGVNNNGF